MKGFKMILSLQALLFASFAGMACEVCKKQQPEPLRGITHGAGPQSDWDYVIVWGMAGIVVISLFYSIKWTYRPGEKDRHHIKRSIINPD